MRKIIVIAAVLGLAAAAHAAQSPGQKCQTSKNQEAGKYAACLAKAEARLLKTEGSCSVTTATACHDDGDCPMGESCTKDLAKYTAAVTKCEDKFEAKWGTLTQKAADALDQCPDGLLAEEIKEAVDEHVANVAAGLAGEGLSTCGGELVTCEDDLTTCETDLGTVETDLTTCNGDLGTCASDLGTATASLATCTGDLGDCNSDLGTCTADLAQAGSDLAAAQSSLTTCTTDLGMCATDLGTAEADLMTCEGELTTVQSDLTTCEGDLVACQAAPQGQRLKTGQTQCWNASHTLVACAGTGQDGEFQKGLTVSFADNSDGTISDMRTGLMWERLNDAGGINDKDALFTWKNAFNKAKVLSGDATGCLGSGNPSSCCTGAGTGSCTAFAGHTDWRLPNRFELESLLNLGTSSPATHAVFNSSCTASCTTCSCTQSGSYWSATTRQNDLPAAWGVAFSDGIVFGSGKTNSFSVRVVRSGS